MTYILILCASMMVGVPLGMGFRLTPALTGILCGGLNIVLTLMCNHGIQ